MPHISRFANKCIKMHYSESGGIQQLQKERTEESGLEGSVENALYRLCQRETDVVDVQR